MKTLAAVRLPNFWFQCARAAPARRVDTSFWFCQPSGMQPATENPPAIGAEIRRLRDSMGMTLQDFGRFVGIPWQTVQSYETGRSMPPTDRFLLIVHATRRAAQPLQVAAVARAIAMPITARAAA